MEDKELTEFFLDIDKRPDSAIPAQAISSEEEKDIILDQNMVVEDNIILPENQKSGGGQAASGMATEIQKVPEKYDVTRFEASLVEPFKSHLYAADSAINLINETKLDWDQQKAINPRKKDITGNFEHIIQIHDKYSVALSPKNVEKEAKRDYLALYEEHKDHNKLQYYNLLHAYRIFKEFNLQIRRNLTTNKQILAELREHSEIRNFVNEIINDKIDPMLLLCDQADELAFRIKRILGSPKEKVDDYNLEVKVEPNYRKDKQYALEQCFKGTLYNERIRELTKARILESFAPNSVSAGKEDKQDPKSYDQAKLNRTTFGNAKLGSIKDFSLDRVEQEIRGHGLKAKSEDQASLQKNRDIVSLELIGKKLWNQSKYYQLSYSKSKYNRSIEKLKLAVYFTDKAHIRDENYIRKKIVVGIARKNRINILRDMRDFLYKQFTILIDEIGFFFNIPFESRILFIFHFGAGKSYEMFRAYLNYTRLGICYISINTLTSNKIKREFFPEIVAEAVKRYWEEQINAKANDSFNNFLEYSKISDMVRQKYQHELEVKRRKLDSIFEKMDPSKQTQKERFFQSHYADWFGMTNIFVYTRFIDRTIFAKWNPPINPL